MQIASPGKADCDIGGKLALTALSEFHEYPPASSAAAFRGALADGATTFPNIAHTLQARRPRVKQYRH